MNLEDFGLVPHPCKTVKVGDRFGHITILAVGKLADQPYKYRAVYRCDCGNIRCVQIGSIQIGTTKSCGCGEYKISKTHGLHADPVYSVWLGMIQRCNDPRSSRYIDYGQRGITVCDRWLSLTNFYSDMHATYLPGLSIDRIDNDGPYSPENCRWANRHTQQRNRRNNIRVEINGKSMILKDWCYEYNQPYSMVYHRVKKLGWSPEKALTTPSRKLS